jgi:hypothetical protein
MNSFSALVPWNMGAPVHRGDALWPSWIGNPGLNVTDLFHCSVKGEPGGSESQVYHYATETVAGNKWVLIIISDSAAAVGDTIREGAVDRLAAESASAPSVGVALATMPGRTPATGVPADFARAPSRGALRLSELPEFLEHLYLLVREEQEQSASVAVIDYIDQLLNESLFRVCNELLRQADLSQMPSALRRAFLMVTWPAKDRLPARPEFYQKALHLLAAERGAETAQRMLKSLA